MEAESRIVVEGAWGREWEVTANGPEGSHWSDRSVLKLDYDGCTAWHLLKSHSNIHLKMVNFMKCSLMQFLKP